MSPNRILLATRKALLTLTRVGGRWQITQEAHGGARLSYAMADSRSGYLYACFDHGHWGVKLKRSKDEGRTWDEIAAPAYYPAAAEIKPGKPAVLTYLWCLVEGPPARPGRLYAGTVPGALFQTDDHGDSWQLVRSLWDHPSRQEQWFGGGMNEPGIHCVVLDPREPDAALVGISCAGVFAGHFGDGTVPWTPRNQGLVADFLPNPHAEIGHDVHFMAQCQAQPDVLWQQNHCGIFRSADRGLTWQAVSQKGETPHFGFAIAASETDPLTAWVVPAESDEVRAASGRSLCVCRTTDGGASWTAFRQGLPQDHCYDFVFRHGLDNRGKCLAMGTAGGSCYVSEDGGESWQVIGNHLPPIYSVRFA
jgi:photosystem II stability/assembly factor-like uncharacterized protein